MSLDIGRDHDRPHLRGRLDAVILAPREELSNGVGVRGARVLVAEGLYKSRGQVDLILTDPPYNTGGDFRYNDKWDTDPKDPDLGELVPSS